MLTLRRFLRLELSLPLPLALLAFGQLWRCANRWHGGGSSSGSWLLLCVMLLRLSLGLLDGLLPAPLLAGRLSWCLGPCTRALCGRCCTCCCGRSLCFWRLGGGALCSAARCRSLLRLALLFAVFCRLIYCVAGCFWWRPRLCWPQGMCCHIRIWLEFVPAATLLHRRPLGRSSCSLVGICCTCLSAVFSRCHCAVVWPAALTTLPDMYLWLLLC